jgi:hypothetical protein
LQIQMNFRIPPWFVDIIVCIDPHRTLVLWWQRQRRGVFTDTQIFWVNLMAMVGGWNSVLKYRKKNWSWFVLTYPFYPTLATEPAGV